MHFVFCIRFGVILLSEYHASSIRLPASCIATQWYSAIAEWYSPLTTWALRAFMANRISLWGEAEQYHCLKGNITLCKTKNITHKNAEKRELYGIVLPHYSLFCFFASSAFVRINALWTKPNHLLQAERENKSVFPKYSLFFLSGDILALRMRYNLAVLGCDMPRYARRDMI